MAGPLSGLRVLDLTRVLAGPWATQTLADLGAEVIKIEKPGDGDDTRGWGPPFLQNADGTRGDAAYFASTNRGKFSVCIDMSKTEGQSLIKQLAAKSDILIENFKVGGLAKYGLDYDSFKVSHPGLIYCSITGFGQNGPYANRAGYDFMIQGMSGLMSVTGEPDGQPMKVGVAFADIFTGLYSVIGILGALHHRNKTGQGQFIDMALLDSQVAVLANQGLNYLVGSQVPGRLGNAHPNIVPYQTFETSDGHMIVAVGNDRQFSEYCRITGVVMDEKFATNRGRVENRDELNERLVPAMKQKTTTAWMSAFEAAAVPCGPINTIGQMFADQQVLARGLQIGQTRSDGVQIPGIANPIVMSETPIEYDRAAPQLGADTEAILRTVLGVVDIEALHLKNIIS